VAAFALVFVLSSGLASALEQTLTSPGGQSSFGTAVAVDGRVAVVGEPQAFDYPSGFPRPGRALVYELSGSSWSPVGELSAPDGAAGDLFGQEVAIDGTTLAVAAPFITVDGSREQGAVYVYDLENLSETPARLTASDGQEFDALGMSVAVDGDTVVAGAPYSDPVAGGSGAVYVFDAAGSQERMEVAKLTQSNAQLDDALGTAVAIEGDTIVATVPRYPIVPADGPSTPRRGFALNFARDEAGVWTEDAVLAPPPFTDPVSVDGGVDIEGETIAVGVPKDRSGQGVVYTYASDGPPDRPVTARLRKSGGGANLSLGRGVAIGGGKILAGSPVSSAAYIFTEQGNPDRTDSSLFAPPWRTASTWELAVDTDGDSTILGGFGAEGSSGDATIYYEAIPPDDPGDVAAPPALRVNKIARRVTTAQLARGLKFGGTCTPTCQVRGSIRLSRGTVKRLGLSDRLLVSADGIWGEHGSLVLRSGGWGRAALKAYEGRSFRARVALKGSLIDDATGEALTSEPVSKTLQIRARG